jgi:hypothetical protein
VIAAEDTTFHLRKEDQVFTSQILLEQVEVAIVRILLNKQ